MKKLRALRLFASWSCDAPTDVGILHIPFTLPISCLATLSTKLPTVCLFPNLPLSELWSLAAGQERKTHEIAHRFSTATTGENEVK